MTRIITLVGAIVTAFSIISALPAQTIPGGSAKAPSQNKNVQNAATYAIAAQQKQMKANNGGRDTKLNLIEILDAEEQIVAGVNYRITLHVQVNGKDKKAEIEVWWQSWRKPDPYQLTSWKWIDQ